MYSARILREYEPGDLFYANIHRAGGPTAGKAYSLDSRIESSRKLETGK